MLTVAAITHCGSVAHRRDPMLPLSVTKQDLSLLGRPCLALGYSLCSIQQSSTKTNQAFDQSFQCNSWPESHCSPSIRRGHKHKEEKRISIRVNNHARSRDRARKWYEIVHTDMRGSKPDSAPVRWNGTGTVALRNGTSYAMVQIVAAPFHSPLFCTSPQLVTFPGLYQSSAHHAVPIRTLLRNGPSCGMVPKVLPVPDRSLYCPK
jgi:hypothetical protein